MAVETRPELVGKRFLCVAVSDEARPERWESGCGWRSWRAGVIRAVSHRDSRNPDLAVRERAPPFPSTASAPGSRRRTLRASLWHLAQPSQLAVTPLCRALGLFARIRCLGPCLSAERLPLRRRCRSETPGIAAETALPPIPEGSTAAPRCGAWAVAETSPKGGAASPAPCGQVGVGGGPLIAIGGQLPWHLFFGKVLIVL